MKYVYTSLGKNINAKLIAYAIPVHGVNWEVDRVTARQLLRALNYVNMHIKHFLKLYIERFFRKTILSDFKPVLTISYQENYCY